MRKWKVELSTGQTFTMESDDPGRALIGKGYTSFSLSEIVPPPPVPPEAHVKIGRASCRERVCEYV